MSLTHTQVSSEWRGPLPPPQQFREYDEVYPGAAKLILDEFQAQSAHRGQLEKKLVDGELRAGTIGQITAPVIAVAGMVVGGLVIASGHATSGGIVGTMPTASIVIAFLYQSHNRREERIKKTKLMVGSDAPDSQ